MEGALPKFLNASNKFWTDDFDSTWDDTRQDSARKRMRFPIGFLDRIPLLWTPEMTESRVRYYILFVQSRVFKYFSITVLRVAGRISAWTINTQSI